MRILFTGSSSFTGYWFIRELVEAGHDVVATFQRKPADYDGVRAHRSHCIKKMCRCVEECGFGQPAFMEAIEQEHSWDVLCHHAADVTNYKSPDFDVPAAVANNTHNLAEVLAALSAKRCRRVVLTGSVFEQREGEGEVEWGELRAFSPYGLSKGLTADVFRHYVGACGMRLGKFVIPNPFGPYEEPRFTAYLIKTWMAGHVARVKTPDYIRDNIHVSLLAGAYRQFVEQLPKEPGFQKLNPSGYAESQGDFAERAAAEMRSRTGLECLVERAEQTAFFEPRKRINTDGLDAAELAWNETSAWDEFAAYYREESRAV